MQHCLFHNWKHHLKPFVLGGTLRPAKGGQMVTDLPPSAQLVRRLAPETGQSRMIDSDREFSQVYSQYDVSSFPCMSRPSRVSSVSRVLPLLALACLSSCRDTGIVILFQIGHLSAFVA